MLEADVNVRSRASVVRTKCPLHTPFHVCLAVIVLTLLLKLPVNLLASWPPNAAADTEDKTKLTLDGSMLFL